MFRWLTVCALLVINGLEGSDQLAWNKSGSKNINHWWYCYAPDTLASSAQAAQVCRQFRDTTTLEHIKSVSGVQIIPGLNIITSNLAEIKLGKPLWQDWMKYLAITAPLLLADYGAMTYCTPEQYAMCQAVLFGVWFKLQGMQLAQYAGSWYATSRYAQIDIKRSQNLPATVCYHAIDISNINMAQQADIDGYLDTIMQARRKSLSNTRKLVLYGIGRGAATALQAFAQLDQQNDTHDIGAVVCEGIFDSVPDLCNHAGYAQKIKIAALMYTGLTSFKKDGPSPITAIDNIKSRRVPLALITSLADTEVPHQNVRAVYDKLKNIGYKKLHLLVLEKSAHSAYATGPEKEIYRNFMHAFYRHYSMPYIPGYAQAGTAMFNSILSA